MPGRHRLSLVYPQAFPTTPDKEVATDIQRLKERGGFDVIELTSISDHRIRTDVIASLRDAAMDAIFLGGLPCVREGHFLNASGTTRTAAVDFVKTLIDQAAEFDALALLVLSGPDPGGAERESSRLNLLTSLRELAVYAHDVSPDLRLRVEHADRSTHRHQLIGPTTEALQLLEALAADGIAVDLNLDLSHILQLGESPQETLQMTRTVCRHLHLSNCILADPSNPLFGDCHPPFAYPGSEVGRSELVRVIRSLESQGYLTDPEMVIGVEVVPLPLSDPWETLDQAVEFVNQAFADAGS